MLKSKVAEGYLNFAVDNFPASVPVVANGNLISPNSN